MNVMCAHALHSCAITGYAKPIAVMSCSGSVSNGRANGAVNAACLLATVFVCEGLCLECLDNRVEALIFELTPDLAVHCSILMRAAAN